MVLLSQVLEGPNPIVFADSHSWWFVSLHVCNFR